MNFLFKNRINYIHKTYLVKYIILIITKIMIYMILYIDLNFVIFLYFRLIGEQIILKQLLFATLSKYLDISLKYK